MKRRVENDDSNNEPNKRQKKLIIDLSSFNFLSQDSYNLIFEQTGDYRSLFPLLFVSTIFNTYTKQFLNNNHKNEIKSSSYASLFCNYLGETNQTDLLKWLYSINCLFSAKILHVVSSNNNDNNLNLLKWLLEIFESKDSILKKAFIKKYYIEECFLAKIVYGAAQKNNQSILEFVRETYLSADDDREKYLEIFFQSIVKGAGKGNQLTLLESTIDSQCSNEDNLITEIFFRSTTYCEILLLKASKHGSFEILQFCIKKVLPKVRASSVDDGELCVQFFNEAFKYGHVKITEWLMFGEGLVNEYYLFGDVDRNWDGAKEKSFSVCESAISEGSLGSLEWAFNKGIFEKKSFGDYGPKLFQRAAEKGRIDILNFLKLHDLEYNDPTCAGAALSGL
jgi:hypothetical protein